MKLGIRILVSGTLLTMAFLFGMTGIVRVLGAGAFGKTFPAEWRVLPALDPRYEVIQLTTNPGDDNKLYYTTNPYIPSKNGLIFASNRTGANNLFWIDLRTGAITQLTDGKKKEIDAPHAVVCPATLEAFYLQGNAVKALKIDSGDERTLYTFDAGRFKIQGSISASTDGRIVTFPIQTRTTPIVSHLVVVYRDKGKSNEITAINGDINHAYIRPVTPDQVLYMVVDNGLYLVNLDGTHNGRLRADTVSENVNHPFWSDNGKILNYSVKTKTGEFWGGINPDNDTFSPLIQLTPSSTHFNINNSGTCLVGDGSDKRPLILFYPVVGNNQIAGLPMFEHNSSFTKQLYHPHPTFINETDGVFDSNRDGNVNIYWLRKK